VSEPSSEPSPYQVSYSERVRIELKNLLALAEERGVGPPVRAAAAKIDYLLHTYPQFGQELRNLSLGSAQEWVGVVAPLVVHYLLDDEQRLVIVTRPITPLHHIGL
jgi:hypothetical protein